MAEVEPVWYIIWRFLLHFFGAGGLVLFRHPIAGLVFRNHAQQLYVTAITVLCVACMREPYDLKHGQSLVKAVIDNISWAAGCTLAFLMLR